MMSIEKLGIAAIVKRFPVKLGCTWLMVALENVILALLPLFIGFAIDDLLSGGLDYLFMVGALLVLVTLVAVARRVYDTRVYGAIRVTLGMAVNDRHDQQPVSVRNARLDMARELVDFLEHELPSLLTAVIQILVTLIVLGSFHWYLAATGIFLILSMLFIYSLFSHRFYHLNGKLNGQMEQQVQEIKAGANHLLFHLNRLKNYEVKLSDTEALVYGLIFLLVSGFVVVNLWLAAGLLELTSGNIFSIVSYSWEYVEAAILLPVSWQTWSRLKEIIQRLNSANLPTGKVLATQAP